MKLKFPLGTEGGDLSETKQITLSVPKAIYSIALETHPIHRLAMSLVASGHAICPNCL